jgi:predicted AlkP superfamily phosphohydrolase/phosphomutase
VRINLQGREPKGVVRPEEYAGLCAQLEEGLRSFVDLATGAPIVDRVLFPWRDHAAAPYRDVLPDVLAVWKAVDAPGAPGARSRAWGEVRWTGPLPSSRAGNHRRHGWFLAVGEGIPAGAHGGSYHILDLLPTLCRWLGVEPAAELQGRPIDVLCS